MKNRHAVQVWSPGFHRWLLLIHPSDTKTSALGALARFRKLKNGDRFRVVRWPAPQGRGPLDTLEEAKKVVRQYMELETCGEEDCKICPVIRKKRYRILRALEKLKAQLELSE